jgi:hypothetical protein
MSVPNFSATIDHFATRLAAEHREMARIWLERLEKVLELAARDVFPTHQNGQWSHDPAKPPTVRYRELGAEDK